MLYNYLYWSQYLTILMKESKLSSNDCKSVEVQLELCGDKPQTHWCPSSFQSHVLKDCVREEVVYQPCFLQLLFAWARRQFSGQWQVYNSARRSSSRVNRARHLLLWQPLHRLWVSFTQSRVCAVAPLNTWLSGCLQSRPPLKVEKGLAQFLVFADSTANQIVGM